MCSRDDEQHKYEQAKQIIGCTMKIISVEQGSQDWLSWRKERITASDAAVILRLNRYSNPTKLWEEKMEVIPAQPTNHHMERGKLLEPIARELFIEQTGIHVEPLVVEHDNFFWMGASLDGIDSSRRVLVEIKCPELGGHLEALNKDIKPMYRAQMQHQLYATDAEMCFYVTYNEHHEQKMSIIEVTRDEKFMQNMINAELEFYKEFIGVFKKPPLNWKPKKAS